MEAPRFPVLLVAEPRSQASDRLPVSALHEMLTHVSPADLAFAAIKYSLLNIVFSLPSPAFSLMVELSLLIWTSNLKNQLLGLQDRGLGDLDQASGPPKDSDL